MAKLFSSISLRRRMKTEEKLFFIQQFSLMLKVGISVTKALKFLGEQQKNQYFKRAILDVYDSVTRGNSLEASMAANPKVFDSALVSLIRVGELRGDLTVVLDNYHELVKQKEIIKKKLKAALIYPSVVITSMIILGALAAVFIFPKIEDLFDSVDLELPVITRIVIGAAHFMDVHGIKILLFMAASVIGFLLVRRTEKGKRAIASVILRLPVASKVMRETNVAQIMRNLSILYKSGMPILSILDTVAKATSQYSYRESLMEAKNQIAKGNRLSEVLRDYPRLYPTIPIELIAVGEETGKLNEVTEEIAEFYEQRVFSFLDALPGILEPVLIFTIGAAVAVIALAVLMPMYSLSSSI